MSEMQTLEGQLDEFVGEPAGYDRDTGEVMQEPKPEEKPRRTRSDKGKPRSKHVDAFSTGQPAPGEERATVNLRHWNALSTTNPKYTKPFRRAGGFVGTAISPSWREMRMTEHFGPVGIGWGMEKPSYQLVPIEGNGELLVYCTVVVWYAEGVERARIWGVGGDKVIARGREGLRTNDEAFKAALTDALGNAMKRIGVAGDVHLGLFDDDKYVRDALDAFAPPNNSELVGKSHEQQPTTPNSGQQHPQQRPTAANNTAQAPRTGPSPEHVKLVLREAEVMKAAGREEALAWFERLEPEDRDILTTAKARRRTRELQS